MDKIYSRKRITIPKVYYENFSNKKISIRKKRMLKISLILIIAISTMFIIIDGINPIINKLCIDASKREATLVSNQKATEVMANYAYEDMVTVYRDNNNNITMLKSNIKVINEITSDVAVKIQEEFGRQNENTMKLKLRKFNRNKNTSRNGTKYSNKNLNFRNSFNKGKK